MPSTYLINHLRIPGETPGEAGLSYLEQVQATAAPYGGEWLAQGQGDVVEGAWPGLAVLMRFPDRGAATAWYASPDYQRILPLRTGGSISDMILIDALPSDFDLKAFVAELRSRGSDDSRGAPQP